ncbi:hypothetical protein AJ87_37410 [Rhizobium yanglingense]|nr:hypothetical protein AJ87_37410 [Rhizobium yanglingense]
MPLTDIVSVIARREDRTALLFGSGRALSYAELDEQTLRFANRLEQGQKRLVAIAAEASEHAIVAYLEHCVRDTRSPCCHPVMRGSGMIFLTPSNRISSFVQLMATGV